MQLVRLSAGSWVHGQCFNYVDEEGHVNCHASRTRLTHFDPVSRVQYPHLARISRINGHS